MKSYVPRTRNKAKRQQSPRRRVKSLHDDKAIHKSEPKTADIIREVAEEHMRKRGKMN